MKHMRRFLSFWPTGSIMWKTWRYLQNWTGQRRIKPRQQVTCTENSVKFVRVVIEICERTDKQTDTQTRISLIATSHPTGRDGTGWVALYAQRRRLYVSQWPAVCIKRSPSLPTLHSTILHLSASMGPSLPPRRRAGSECTATKPLGAVSWRRPEKTPANSETGTQ